jgi:hypothetical protein
MPELSITNLGWFGTDTDEKVENLAKQVKKNREAIESEKDQKEDEEQVDASEEKTGLEKRLADMAQLAKQGVVGAEEIKGLRLKEYGRIITELNQLQKAEAFEQQEEKDRKEIKQEEKLNCKNLTNQLGRMVRHEKTTVEDKALLKTICPAESTSDTTAVSILPCYRVRF